MSARDEISALLAERSTLLAAAARDLRLTAVDVRVAVLLLDRIHRKTGPRFGLMWPSVAALAQEAGISRRWATECLRHLTGFSYFVPIDGNGGGRSVTVTYRM